MTLPSVCVLIPTFARTALLAEAIECVIRLEYKGKLTALVCNDCTRQIISINDRTSFADAHFDVIVQNRMHRYATLADKRHAMLSMTDADYVCFLDDDDLMLPWYLNGVTWSKPVTFPQRQFRTDGDNWWDEVVPGGLWMTIERKLALSIGFTSGLNVGEDNAFRNAVIEKVGKHNLALDPTPAYVYRSTIVGGMHISKAVDHRAEPDIPMYLKSANQRMDDGREPTGIVNLSPAWRQDYAAKARSIMGAQ